MKPGIYCLVAVTLAPSPAVLAGNYKVFAAQGYRWVTADSPIFAMPRKMFDNLSLTIPMPQSFKQWKTSIATTSYRELSFR